MQQISAEAASKTAKVMHVLKDAFTRAPGDKFLAMRELGALDIKGIAPGISYEVVNNLVSAKVLERNQRASEGVGTPVREYRPTAGGWELFSRLGDFSPEELHKLYRRGEVTKMPSKAASAPAKRSRSHAVDNAIPCKICGDGIRNRRDGAQKCWGCEQQGKRVIAGMDHVPRTDAYLRTLKPLARDKELDRVREVIRSQRRRLPDKQPFLPAKRPVVDLPGAGLVSTEAVFEKLKAIEDRLDLIDGRLASIGVVLRAEPERALKKPNGAPNGVNGQSPGLKSIMAEVIRQEVLSALHGGSR